MINTITGKIDPKVKNVFLTLKELVKETFFEGKVYIVGGAIRDLLLGNKIKDIDIVVELESGGLEFAKWLAEKDNSFVPGKNPVVFENYGTAKFQFKNIKGCEGVEIECVQTRKEQYHKESRNPDTVFGTIKEDAARRDLTINALYYNVSDGKIYDFNGTGISDLHNKIIRTPSDPDIVFTDDPLRILRVIRFSSRLGWDIEKNTWLGMIKNANRISIISQERITDEISKILLTKKPSIGITKLLYCGMLHRVLPDIYDTKYVYESLMDEKTTFEHTMEMIDYVQPTLKGRLAALFHDIGKIVTNKNRSISDASFSSEITAIDLKKMKYPNAVISSVEKAIKHMDFFSCLDDGVMPSDKRIRKFLNICGDDSDIVLDLINAENNLKSFKKRPAQIDNIRERIKDLETIEEIQNIKLPINGNDIIKHFGIKGGPIIGTILSEIKDQYFENPKITESECFQIAEKTIQKMAI